MTTPEFIDQIHELILEDCRISAKSIAEQLSISRERVGSIIHEDLYMRKLSAKWVPKCLNADQKRQRCQSSGATFGIFFRRDRNDFLSRLVTMDEVCLYHCDPETKQQSLLPRRPDWTDDLLNFLSGLQKVEQRAKKYIELRGECVE